MTFEIQGPRKYEVRMDVKKNVSGMRDAKENKIRKKLTFKENRNGRRERIKAECDAPTTVNPTLPQYQSTRRINDNANTAKRGELLTTM